jgi:hypothetical protein
VHAAGAGQPECPGGTAEQHEAAALRLGAHANDRRRGSRAPTISQHTLPRYVTPLSLSLSKSAILELGGARRARIFTKPRLPAYMLVVALPALNYSKV